MKTMTCKQLGGPCDMKIHGNTFDEISEASRKHAMEMAEKGDKPHIDAMNKMKEMMKDEEAMKSWMKERQEEFESLPED